VLEKTKGITNKRRTFNPKRIIKWLREVWDRRQKAVLKKRGMLYGSLNIERENCNL
jgi:hypothetical protein